MEGQPGVVAAQAHAQPVAGVSQQVGGAGRVAQLVGRQEMLQGSGYGLRDGAEERGCEPPGLVVTAVLPELLARAGVSALFLMQRGHPGCAVQPGQGTAVLGSRGGCRNPRLQATQSAADRRQRSWEVVKGREGLRLEGGGTQEKARPRRTAVETQRRVAGRGIGWLL